MKHLLLIFISLLTIYACTRIDNREILSNDSFLQNINDSTKTTRQILDKFLPGVLAFAKADTSDFYYGNNVIEEDSIFRQLLIGKFINRKKIIATEINIKDTVINFFYLNKKKMGINWE